MASALLLVDVQKDFCPGGNLAVAGGNEVPRSANTLRAKGKFDYVFLSQDWHPANHISFASVNAKDPFTSISLKNPKTGVDYTQTIW